MEEPYSLRENANRRWTNLKNRWRFLDDREKKLAKGDLLLAGLSTGVGVFRFVVSKNYDSADFITLGLLGALGAQSYYSVARRLLELNEASVRFLEAYPNGVNFLREVYNRRGRRVVQNSRIREAPDEVVSEHQTKEDGPFYELWGQPKTYWRDEKEPSIYRVLSIGLNRERPSVCRASNPWGGSQEYREVWKGADALRMIEKDFKKLARYV